MTGGLKVQDSHFLVNILDSLVHMQERSQRLYHVEAHQNILRIKRYLTLFLYFSDSE